MVDYERGLGDLGFRGNKGRVWPETRAWGSPKLATWRNPRAATTWRRPAARARVFGCEGEGQPYPSLYRWEGAAWEEGVLPQVGLHGRRVEGGGLPPQVGFLLSLHQAKTVV